MQNIPYSAAILMLLLSCKTARKEFDPTECNEQSAKERGYIEGKEGHDPDSNYAFRCREDLRSAVRKGYNDGYIEGRKEYKEMLAKWEAEQALKNSSSLALPAPPPTPSFFCKINWGSRGYEASGFTLDEARAKVVDQCSETFSRHVCLPLPQCKNSPSNSNPRAIYCSLQVFTRKYEAFGPTELETQSALGRDCTEQEKSDFFCKPDKMKCKRNQ